MKELTKFQLDGEESILVEIDEHDAGYRLVADPGEYEIKTPGFKQALNRVRPAAEQLMEVLKNMARRPDKIEVQFGLKLSGKVGAIIAATSTSANFDIKLTWDSSLEHMELDD